MNLLIVEDEVRLADALAQIMRENKHSCDVVYNGNDGLDYAQSGNYDVIVLDVMLPGMNGLDIVSSLRRSGNATPVLMLTARDELRDKVSGLDSGADDYMTKPFAPEELLARIRALSRRQGEVHYEEISYKDIELKLSTHDLCRGAKSVHLGYKEFEVMRLLLLRPDAILPKEELICKVWGADSAAEDNNVEAYISFLRKKLFYLGSKVEISTIRKVGYKLVMSGEEARRA